YNEIKEVRGTTALQIFFRQFKNFLILLLLAAALVSAFIGLWEHGIQEMIEAGLIVLIVLFIVCVGFYQEYHAEKDLEALKRMLDPAAVVERGTQKKKIPARELVPGDIIHLEAGDRVPADSRIVEAVQLKIDESVLTGEADPVRKGAGVLDGELPVGDRSNMTHMGTTVTYGKGKALVVATGMETEFGRIACRIQEIEDEKTPLQERLDVIGRQIGWGVLCLCAVVFVVGILAQEMPWLEMFLVAVALAVAAVPEGLPGVVVVALGMGTRRMVARHVIVRKLPAVETLGCTTVICSDKTGTITHNQMTVRRVFADGKTVEVSGDGYTPEGGFSIDGKKMAPRDDPVLDKLLRAAALCNNASLFHEAGEWKTTGDPTEICLLVAAEKAGIRRGDLRETSPRVGETAFSSERKRMATIHKEGGSFTAYVKGAPDILSERCSSIQGHDGIRPLSSGERGGILQANERMANDALRVLAVAYRAFVHENAMEDAEEDLVFLGLLGMKDPPRDEAKAAIGRCREAGIRTVMITGDHPATALAVAREIGLNVGSGQVITGAELSKMPQNKLKERIEDTTIFARVSPEHKLRIVSALQDRGHVVAMTGDGVNDAPALKKADIGVAMGISGTDVAREASDMVLTDDNFSGIVGAVKEGRGIYDNIRKFFAYLISGNIGEVLILFISSLWTSVPIALTATQILIINLVTDGLPALALGADPFEPNAMKRSPRSRTEPLHHGLAPFILVYPIIMAAVALGVLYRIYDPAAANEAEARTAVFLTVAFFEMFQSFSARSTRYPSIKVGLFKNRWLVLAVAGSLAVCVGLVYAPLRIPFLGVDLHQLVRLVPLPLSDFFSIVALSSLGFVYLELSKAYASRKVG
ncbi:MAG: cation-translocating P-type ATPase, partial [Deltaproteobacteria bacterium]|nr:cation-translocating P-type ATPase [Deltaproteobacteria bacterium]